MIEASEIRDTWGADQFVRCDPVKLAGLGLLSRDRTVLEHVGLPVGPETALTLSMRFENVQLIHSLGNIRALSDALVQKPPRYPLTGDPDVDTWARLDNFVVLGSVPYDVESTGRRLRSRFICLDGTTGRVAWVSPDTTRGTACYS